MGWSIGFDSRWNRDIGYGVPAVCDYPECGEVVDRGLSYVCGGQPYGGEHGCGLFFCEDHLMHAIAGRATLGPQQCERCAEEDPPFEPTPDTREWIEHKLTDESWAQWRDENPEAVSAMRAACSPR